MRKIISVLILVGVLGLLVGCDTNFENNMSKYTSVMGTYNGSNMTFTYFYKNTTLSLVTYDSVTNVKKAQTIVGMDTSIDDTTITIPLLSCDGASALPSSNCEVGKTVVYSYVYDATTTPKSPTLTLTYVSGPKLFNLASLVLSKK